jgi:hypothetical protein
MRIWMAILTASCAGASASVARPATELRDPGPAPPPIRAFVDRAPGPIAGRYRVACPENEGEILTFTVDGNRAVGRVAEPGASRQLGFKKGEDVFRLAADAYGDWVGEVHYRSVTGAQHWDAIRLVATDTSLNGTMTNEPCYRSMPRLP